MAALGGNLCMVGSLLGTRHWPRSRAASFLEDVNEHRYRVERMLLQLHQAGVLAQKAVLLGAFTEWRPRPLDRGCAEVGRRAPAASPCTPILTGLPVRSRADQVCLPVGARVTLAVEAATPGSAGEPGASPGAAR